MDRRSWLASAVCVLAARLGAEAQPAARVPRVAFVSLGAPSDPLLLDRFKAFQDGLRDAGYVDGQTIAIESRWAHGRQDRLPGLAAELVRSNVNVIVATGVPVIEAVKQATDTIPIVIAGAVDPVATGFAVTLARPGGNITGLSLMAPDLVGKQLEILKELVPRTSRVAILGNPVNSGTASQLRRAQDAARVLGLRLITVDARTPAEIDGAFAAMTREHAGALIVLVDRVFLDQRARIAALATKSRLPAMYAMADHVEAGGLMIYGPSVSERYRRAAVYVDKLLRGAKPADLPIEQPTRFELVINVSAARALGLTVPPSLLLRADKVVE
jgi:putative ABC transport system substrate-binding protein